MTLYRTTDNTRWGAGIGRNLTAAEGDIRNWEIDQAILDLQTTRPQPNDIASITVVGAAMTITLTDGTPIGPITLPVAALHWRNEWAPFTVYELLDFVTVEGLGIYSVEIAHTSAATFDAALLISGDGVYRQVWAFDDAATTGVIYDIGFFYQDLLSASVTDRLWEMVAARTLFLPATGDQHEASLREAPSTAAQVLAIYHDGSQIGHIDFAIGQNAGSVTITADETILKGELLEVGVPPLTDPTASGLSVMFAAQRVI